MKKIFFFIVLLTALFIVKVFPQTEEPYNVLLISAYCNNNSSGKSIVDSINAELQNNSHRVNVGLVVENIDTEDLEEEKLELYLDELDDIFRMKYENLKFDAVVVIGDGAFKFVNENISDMFRNVPVIFGGLKTIEGKTITIPYENLSGYLIPDFFEENIKMINEYFEFDRIYYVSNLSNENHQVEKDIEKKMEYFEFDIELEYLDLSDMDDVRDRLYSTDEKVAIFVLSCNNGGCSSKMNIDNTMEKLEILDGIPIFSENRFYIENGAIGGVVMNAYEHGKRTAERLLELLETGLSVSGIEHQDECIYMFNHKKIKEFGYQVNTLPVDSIFWGYDSKNRDEVLVLHSYDRDFPWTSNIDKGIRQELFAYNGSLNIHTEFLDLKRNNSPDYIGETFVIIGEKYRNSNFDIIIVSDDLAYGFAKLSQNKIFNGAPLVYCGINNNTMEDDSNNIWGVLEHNDIEGTIKLALEIQPLANEVVVINDNTQTGILNRQNIKSIENMFTEQKFVYTDNMDMERLKTYISKKDDFTILLLMSFNRDSSNNIFTYEEAIEQIYKYANTPLFGVWDFYLGKGLAGGIITSGYEQGLEAGKLAVSILKGEDMQEYNSHIRVNNGTNIPAFDYIQIDKFNIDEKLLPEGTLIINKPQTLGDSYRDNIEFFNVLFAGIIILLIAVITLIRKNMERRESVAYHMKEADTDFLTGILNRRAGIRKTKYILDSEEYDMMTIAFVDVDGLKHINDNFGHLEGDFLLKNTASILKNSIRTEDILFRYGGDEFVIIFPGKCEDDIIPIMERINEGLGKMNKRLDKEYKAAISTGLEECWVMEEADIEDLIRKADNKMYKNKRKISSKSKK